jgi:hypothetical protein
MKIRFQADADLNHIILLATIFFSFGWQVKPKIG